MADAKAADTPPAEPAGAQPGQRPQLFHGYNFKLVLDGINEAQFTQVLWAPIKVTPVRFRAGGDASIVHQLAGPVEYGDVTLRYGLTASPELWRWFLTAISGNPERKHVSIVMLGPGAVGEGVRWNLVDAWPSVWHGAPLDALGREFAVESLTLVYESLSRA